MKTAADWRLSGWSYQPHSASVAVVWQEQALPGGDASLETEQLQVGLPAPSTINHPAHEIKPVSVPELLTVPVNTGVSLYFHVTFDRGAAGKANVFVWVA